MSLLKKYRSLILMTLLIGWYFFYIFSNQFFIPPGHLKITMLNIGQGDAILMQIGRTHFRTIDVLVDAGPDHTVVYELGDALPPWNKTIEYAMATHEDADHIAGFAELVEYYAVEQWVISGREKDTNISDGFHAAMERSSGQQQVVQRGDVVEFGNDASFTVLNPTAVTHKDINDDSIMGILQFSDFSMMLTGDGSILNEEDIIAVAGSQGIELDVNVLKAGHHGSKTSTSSEWLEATRPEIVLISAGIDNTFGHPHYRVIKDIQNIGATVFQTNRDGRIVCLSDGEGYECKPARSSAFQMLSTLGLTPK